MPAEVEEVHYVDRTVYRASCSECCWGTDLGRWQTAQYWGRAYVQSIADSHNEELHSTQTKSAGKR